jgi:hypothetical protein
MKMNSSLISEVKDQSGAEDHSARLNPAGAAIKIGTFLCLVSFVWIAIWRTSPPNAVEANAPLTKFSAHRAFEHLRFIASRPHPIGSEEQEKVRNYLVGALKDLGLNVSVQQTTVVGSTVGGHTTAGTVHNVLARIPGSQNTKAVMLVAHYDSAANSLGASDDGAGVAAILEMTRALKSEKPLRNDVIVLLTDGEESGLLGAEAFVAEHQWMKDAGLILNFEARGSKGPVYMFETSNGNGWLIKRLADASSRPFAASYMYDVYKLLPNTTDLSSFRRAGIPGLNFAYIAGNSTYHTQLDNLDNLDIGSLQHHGSYGLELSRAAGNMDLNNIVEPDAIYFDILGVFLIHYPVYLATPISIVVTLLFVGLMCFGIKNGRLRFSGLFLGALSMLLTVGCAIIVSIAVREVLPILGRGKESIFVWDLLPSKQYFLAMIFFTVAISSVVFSWFGRKANSVSLLSGALLWWVVMMFLSSFLLPGASYLFTYPLLFGIASLAVLTLSDSQHPHSIKNQLLSLGCMAPGIFLVAPPIYSIFIGLGLNQAAAPLVLTALLVGLLLRQFFVIGTKSRKLLAMGSLLAGIVLMVCGSLNVNYSKTFKKANSVFYALDADNNSGIWAGFDQKPDEWTSQFFQAGVERKPLPNYFPNSNRLLLNSPAPAAELPAPDVTVLSDQRSDQKRILQLRVRSPRRAPIMNIYVSEGRKVMSVAINGKPIKAHAINQNESGFSLRYFATPPDGIDIYLETTAAPITIRVIDQSYGLPHITGTTLNPRPEYMMPSPMIHFNQDATMVGKSFHF